MSDSGMMMMGISNGGTPIPDYGFTNFWRFDEESGTLAADHIGGLDFTLTGGGFTWEVGDLIHPGGDPDKYLVSPAPGYTGGGGGHNWWTMGIWFTWEDTADDRAIMVFGKGDSSANADYAFIIFIDADGFLCFRVSNGSSISLQTTNIQPVSGQKYFLAVKYQYTGLPNPLSDSWVYLMEDQDPDSVVSHFYSTHLLPKIAGTNFKFITRRYPTSNGTMAMTLHGMFLKIDTDTDALISLANLQAICAYGSEAF